LHTDILSLVVDTGDKFITSVNDPGGKFITGVNNTNGKFIDGTPLVNLLLVSTTLVIKNVKQFKFASPFKNS